MQDFKGILQVAIAVCLLVIAGLLFSIYHKLDTQKNQEAAAPAPAVATQPATPAPPAATAPDPAPAQPARKPAPASPVTKSKSATTIADAQPPPTIPNMTREAPIPASAAAPPVPDSSASAPPPVYTPTAPAPPPPVRTVTLPAGTAFTVRLLDRIDSERNHTGDTFQCALDETLTADGVVVANRGSLVVGRLVQARQSGRVSGTAEITLEVDRLTTIAGDTQIDTEVTRKEAPSQRGKDATKIGVLTGLGAVIGAIAGHGKGAAIGAGAGAGVGTVDVLATKGKPIKLEPETRLTFRLRSALTIAADGSRLPVNAQGFNNNPNQPTTDSADRPYLRRRNPEN